MAHPGASARTWPGSIPGRRRLGWARSWAGPGRVCDVYLQLVISQLNVDVLRER